MNIKEAISRHLIDEQSATFTEPISGTTMPYEQALQLQYITMEEHHQVEVTFFK